MNVTCLAPDYQCLCWIHRGHVCGFLLVWLQIDTESFFCFTAFLLIYISLWCFTDATEDPCLDQTYIWKLITSRLIRIHAVSHSLIDFWLKLLAATMDFSKFRDERVHFRNPGMKELKHQLNRYNTYLQPSGDRKILRLVRDEENQGNFNLISDCFCEFSSFLENVARIMTGYWTCFIGFFWPQTPAYNH